MVQAEIGGVLMPPDRVREVREDDGQKWVFLETSTTGVEMERVQVLEKAAAGSTKPPPFLPLEAGWREERLLDDNNEEILIRYKGDASPERYTFIRDYLNFKLARLKPKS